MRSRATRQKELLGRELEKMHSFFTAEELHDRVKGISLATVYRYLKDLRSSRQIFSYLCDGRHVYSKEKKSHCHFVCEKSGKVIHFDVGSIDFLKDKIPGKISSFQIEVHGVCEDCDP